jgi:hypothetical protein
MKWKSRDKEAKMRKQIVDERFDKIYATQSATIRAESIEEFLARGGKIKKVQPKKH